MLTSQHAATAACSASTYRSQSIMIAYPPAIQRRVVDVRAQRHCRRRGVVDAEFRAPAVLVT